MPLYDAPLIASLLRDMPAERLAVAHPFDFQRWPATVITPAAVIRELIANEQSRRRAHG